VSPRAAQVATTLVAGALVGAALVFLPLRDPQTAPAGGPLGPPLDGAQTAGGVPLNGADPAGQGADPASQGADPAAPTAPVQAVPTDEDWLDEHLREAPAVWSAAAGIAASHPAAEVRAQAAALRALAGSAPPTGAEVPPLAVSVPYLSAEIEAWLVLSAVEADFPLVAAHLAPLVPEKILVEASRSQTDVPSP